MKRIHPIFLLMILSRTLLTQAISQISLPPEIRLQTSFYRCMQNTFFQVGEVYAKQADAVSDGQGHHYVIQSANGQIQHLLFDDLSTNIHQALFASNATHPSITSRNGKLHVALKTIDQIELWESVNGGSSWTSLGSRSIAGEFSAIDSYEDDRGIHITYTTSSGTYYRLYGPTGWNNFLSTIVRSDPATNVLPAIVATAESVHVFSSQGGGLRSFMFPIDQSSGSWQESTAPISSPFLPSAVEVIQRSEVTSPEERYMFAMFRPPGTNVNFSRSFRKYVPIDPWQTVNGLLGARFKAFTDEGLQDVILSPADFNTPMPWTMYGQMTDEDLGAIYDYLRTIKPVQHQVQKFSAMADIKPN